MEFLRSFVARALFPDILSGSSTNIYTAPSSTQSSLHLCFTSRGDMVDMPTPPPPLIHLRPCSPSSSSHLDAPPPTRRRLFSTPLQHPLVPVPPPPRHSLSFKINGSAASNPNIPIPPPPRRALSFNINDGSTLGPGGDTCTSVC